MKVITIVKTVLLVAILSACDKKDYQINDEVSISFGKSVEIQLSNKDKIKIEFDDLLVDSRCPPNATCFWAGECTFTFKINEKEKLTFGFYDDEYLPFADFGNNKITILEVKYDKDANFGIENHCLVKFKVE